AAFDQTQAAVVLLRQALAAFDGAGIAIDAPHRAVRRIEQRAAVAAGAERAIDIDGAVARLQGFDHFGQQNGTMCSAGCRSDEIFVHATQGLVPWVALRPALKRSRTRRKSSASRAA